METLRLKPNASPHLKKLSFIGDQLYIRNAEAIYVIEKKEISFLHADGNYCKIFLQDGRNILSSKTLKHYHSLLQEPNFIRVHQSYLLNVKYLKELRLKGERIAILKDDSRLPVSRSRFPFLLEQLQNLP